MTGRNGSGRSGTACGAKWGFSKRFPRTDCASGGGRPLAAAMPGVFVHDRQLAREAADAGNSSGRGRIPGNERVVCLDEKDGRVRWAHEYDCSYTVSYAAGPRATPLVHQGKVYTLGAEGDLHCLDAATGQALWARNFTRDFECKTPIWGFAGHPLLDGQKLICLVGGEGSVAVAFDKDTGKELWRALTAREPGYAPPMIYEYGGQRQLILWHAEAVNGLDPETGRVLWTHRAPIRSGMSIATPRQLGDRLFLTSFYSGSLMLRIGGNTPPEVLWQTAKASEKDTQMLHSVMSTPVVLPEHIYGSCSYGQFRCLKTGTGERVWETFAPTTGKSERWGNAFIVAQGDRYFLFNEQGDLILARLRPEAYEELGRVRLLEANNRDAGRPVVWSHPAFANRSVYARNDAELVCASLAQE
jgi:outer membrane protein assembly factor BamB